MREHGTSGGRAASSLPYPDREANSIVEGILAEAEQQARQVLADQENELRLKLQRAEEQAAALLREAEAHDKAQVVQIMNEARARSENEKRKADLTFRQQLESQLINAAVQHLAGDIGQAGYADVLCAWIVEAAIGLDAEAATVLCSESELPQLQDQLLRRAERDILKFCGKSVALSPGGINSLNRQGVMLVAAGGRLAYDNTVPARLERKRPLVRKLLHTALFEAELT